MTDLVTLDGASYPSLLPEQQALVSGLFSDSYDHAPYTVLSCARFSFALKGAISEQLQPNDALRCVILAEGPRDHCVWYAQAYNPQEAGKAPDALWYRGDPAPANVPPTVLEKRPDGRYQYQICRRIVLGLIRTNPTTGETRFDPTPIIFDVGSMSLYNKDVVGTNGVVFQGFAGYRRMLARAKLYPVQVITQIVIDRQQSVPSVRFVPVRNQDGTIYTLSGAVLDEVLEATRDPDIPRLRDAVSADSSMSIAPPPAEPAAPVATPAPAPAPVIALWPCLCKFPSYFYIVDGMPRKIPLHYYIVIFTRLL